MTKPGKDEKNKKKKGSDILTIHAACDKRGVRKLDNAMTETTVDVVRFPRRCKRRTRSRRITTNCCCCCCCCGGGGGGNGLRVLRDVRSQTAADSAGAYDGKRYGRTTAHRNTSGHIRLWRTTRRRKRYATRTKRVVGGVACACRTKCADVTCAAATTVAKTRGGMKKKKQTRKTGEKEHRRARRKREEIPRATCTARETYDETEQRTGSWCRARRLLFESRLGLIIKQHWERAHTRTRTSPTHAHSHV